VHIRKETDRTPPMTMPQALMYFASNYPFGESPNYLEMTAQQLADYKEHIFWKIVSNCIDNDRNLITLYHQPQYWRCWKHTSATWIEDALEAAEWAEQTDRQTDTLQGYAFEN